MASIKVLTVSHNKKNATEEFGTDFFATFPQRGFSKSSFYMLQYSMCIAGAMQTC